MLRNVKSTECEDYGVLSLLSVKSTESEVYGV